MLSSWLMLCMLAVVSSQTPLLSLFPGVDALVTSRQKPATPPSAASFYVPRVPDLVLDPSSPVHVWAGHISADPNAKTSPSDLVTAQLYFVLTKARRTADKERLIIWFNGGPGCSSFDGLMMEVGPWRMDNKDSIKQKEGGWEEYSHILYLDQPPGTGFSYTSSDSYLHELDEVADYVIEFLKNWYEVFPEFKDMDTYLAGESFAGQYIPYIADGILRSRFVSTPLKGIAIGNGWIDPVSQYPAYVEFAVRENLLKEGTKEYKSAMETLDECQKALNGTEKLTPHMGPCEGVLDQTVRHLQSTVNGQSMCINVYDIRLSDSFPACGMNWPPDLAYITPYLQRDDVQLALHAQAKETPWNECSGTVGQNMYNHKSTPSVDLLPRLLEQIDVMLFYGDQDLICNWVGGVRMIENLEWNGAVGWDDGVEPMAWSVNGTEAGEWTVNRNLTYVKIFGASHMVGFDVPHIAHDMMLRFMGVDFSSIAHGSAVFPSKLGDSSKPTLSVGGGGVVGGGGGGDSVPPPVGEETGGEDTHNGDGSKVEPVAPPPDTKPNGGSTGGSEADDSAMWTAYYNAGSSALVLVLVALAIGLFLYFRKGKPLSRLAHSKGLSLSSAVDDEESIPLSRSHGDDPGTPMYKDSNGKADRKGKSRALDEQETIFDVGDAPDSDEEDSTPRRMV